MHLPLGPGSFLIFYSKSLAACERTMMPNLMYDFLLKVKWHQHGKSFKHHLKEFNVYCPEICNIHEYAVLNLYY